jgi:hypothetical protein
MTSDADDPAETTPSPEVVLGGALPPDADPLIIRLVTVLLDRDPFRVVIRGFGVMEDLMEREIRSLLAESLDGLEGAPFRHKLNLALALRIVRRDRRAGFDKLAALRHQLAHADREPADVTASEMDGIRGLLDPDRTVEDLMPERPEVTLAKSAALMILAACMHIQAAGAAAQEIRRAEREAFQRELLGQRRVASLLVRAAAGDFDSPGPPDAPGESDT